MDFLNLAGVIIVTLATIGIIAYNSGVYSRLCKYINNKIENKEVSQKENYDLNLFNIEKEIFINSPEFKNNLERAEHFHKEIQNHKLGYFRHSTKEKLKKNYESLFKTVSSVKYKKFKITHFNEFRQVFKNIDVLVRDWNKSYIISETNKCSELFNNFDGRKLDEQQRRAVVVDEDNNLVLAAAGSGKTLTISAKVKYLVEEKNINPKDILLITFTRKAADEMRDRISERLKINVQVKTFHRFGFDVHKNVTGHHPDVFDNLSDFADNYFKNEFLHSQQGARNIIEYLGLYINIPTNYDDVECLGEIIDRERNLDFETIKSKVEANVCKYSRNKKTFRGEHVRSIEEAMIANHLYLKGVSYEYEKLYPFKTEDASRKRYRPDFYLSDYDLYLEHFGIDEKGNVPWLPPIEAQKYVAGITWKRNYHKQNGTILLETYSYYNKDGRLLVELDKLLKKSGVKSKKLDYSNIWRMMVIEREDHLYSEFRKLAVTFINLLKSNDNDEEAFSLFTEQLVDQKNIFLRNRTKNFLSIVRPLFISYQKMLCDEEYIDFNDMINLATKSINEGKLDINYKYIIIDEYQDISMSRFRLVKALKDRTNAVVMAVGDDWQSIYRFAGSDIDLFTSIEKYFGNTEILKLERTYRNAQELIDIAGKFILKNPKQLDKKLISNKRLHNPIRIVMYKNDLSDAIDIALEEIVKGYGENSKILILGRNNYDIEALKKAKCFNIYNNEKAVKISALKYPLLNIEFMTVHKSKGLEAENVIVINMENNLSGFPNKIVDDPILSFVLSNNDVYEYAEERRLFYVAMTRTKNITYLLAPVRNESCFIKELVKESKHVYYRKVTDEKLVNRGPKCPRCKEGRLIQRENSSGQKFVGCSNYPRCDRIYDNVDILNLVIVCDLCNGYMVKRMGKYGEFYGCSNYPLCTNKINISEIMWE
jgi:DNA helicase-4